MSLSDELKQFFERAGATLETSGVLVDRYGLDFVVKRLARVDTHVHLGVRTGRQKEDLEGMRKVAQAGRRGVVDRAIYVEVEQEAIEAGGLLVAYGACLAHVFGADPESRAVIGAHVGDDLSFRRFNLEEALGRLERKSEELNTSIGEALIGKIIAYFIDKGFGFIQTDDERKYFFHIVNIVDDELREQLPDYMPGEVIPVDFQYGGDDGKKYPKAIQITPR